MPPVRTTNPLRNRKPRSPGRPVAGVRDQRASLLDAAQHSFAHAGFAGSSLRQIALEAKVTPALAHYYFADKASLLEAVITHRVAPLIQGIAKEVADAGPDPIAALGTFVHSYTATAVRNPWVPQLIVREVLSEQGVLREAFAVRFATAMTSQLRKIIVRGQRAGTFRRDVQPAAAVMSLMSLCVLPFIATPLVSGVLGIQVDAAHAESLANHHLKIFLDGIEATP
jgi:AcrR family transcriptional regulator